MTGLSEANETIRVALLMAATEPAKAVALLSTALSLAEQRGSTADVAAIAKHAGAICQGRGDFQSALVFFRKAISMSPDDPHLGLVLGQLLDDLGQTDEARRTLQRSVELLIKAKEDDVVVVAQRLIREIDSRGGP